MQEVIQKLLKDPIIQECRLKQDAEAELINETGPSSSKHTFGQSSSSQPNDQTESQIPEGVPEDIFNFYEKMEKDEDDAEEMKTVSFEVDKSQIEVLRKRCMDPDVDYPLLTEYDFRNDSVNADIK
jgi:DNA excision repair protein ERCC-3